MNVTRAHWLPIIALLPLLLVGCASTEKRYQGAGQWVVVSTNAAASRLGTTNLTTGTVAPIVAPLDRQTFRQDLEQRGVPGEVLQRVSDGKPLSLTDIEILTRQKVPDDKILQYLSSTDTVYVLTTKDIEQLGATGISAGVIDYLLSTRLRPTIVPRYEYYPAYRPYYYEPFYGYPAYPYHYYYYPRSYPRSVIRKK